MALPPEFFRNGPFVDFNPGGFTTRDIEKFITEPWGKFAAKADAIAKASEDRIAALEARVTALEAQLKRRDANGKPVRRRTRQPSKRRRYHADFTVQATLPRAHR